MRKRNANSEGTLVKTSAVSAADLARSVLAVPPLARNADLTLNPAANAVLIRHLEAGGVSTLMCGGNANFYNIGMYEYGAILDFLEQTVAPESIRSAAQALLAHDKGLQ
jgi:hypothetical protein